MCPRAQRLTLLGVLFLPLFGCVTPEPRVGKARLAEADGVRSAPNGETVELLKGQPAPAVKGEGNREVRVAADRDVPWREVVAFEAALRKSGARPVYLVAKRNKIMALPPSDPPAKDPILLTARLEGKACVSPPGTEEAMCVARSDKMHIDRAFVRELVRKAVKEYRITQVRVVVDPELGWGDAVRAMDGARTCCGATNILVSVE